jgi:hypothetical protein
MSMNISMWKNKLHFLTIWKIKSIIFFENYVYESLYVEQKEG